jgi:transposase
MKDSATSKLEAITTRTLVVGIDIAKKAHWGQAVDYRGIPIGKAIRFNNDKEGFELILSTIGQICKERGFNRVIVGMEPTGPYWKASAYWLREHGVEVVGVNTHHTKQAKCLDDNSPTKNDQKDALVIARLVKDGRYFRPYLPTGVYAELRGASAARICIMRRLNAVKNRIIGFLDEYFPEYARVFRCPLKGKVSLHLLGVSPFPEDVVRLGEEGVLSEIRKAVKKTVGRKKAVELVRAAEVSIGVRQGLGAARARITALLAEHCFLSMQLNDVEAEMERLLGETGYRELLLGIKGVGVVTAASFLGQIGDPPRFQNARQICRMAGYNLTEDSSGQSKSRTHISKRGRKDLRSVLYQMAYVMVLTNPEMKRLYQYLTSRPANPLARKQALVVVSKKAVIVIYQILKTGKAYDPALVLGAFRQEQIRLAA